MKYVLDSNVFKFVGSKRKPNIDAWIGTVNDNDIYITVMTLQESAKGIEKLRKRNDPEQKSIVDDLERRLLRYIAEQGERILPLDTAAALEWGKRLASQGTKDANDLAILAIAATQPDAVVVTMNVDDFAKRGITVIDPSKSPARVIAPD